MKVIIVKRFNPEKFISGINLDMVDGALYNGAEQKGKTAQKGTLWGSERDSPEGSRFRHLRDGPELPCA
jgi:hypothetical protein